MADKIGFVKQELTVNDGDRISGFLFTPRLEARVGQAKTRFASQAPPDISLVVDDAATRFLADHPDPDLP